MEHTHTEESSSLEVYNELRAPKSLQRKIARAVSIHSEHHEFASAEDIDSNERSLAKVIKRVITEHNKGK